MSILKYIKDMGKAIAQFAQGNRGTVDRTPPMEEFKKVDQKHVDRLEGISDEWSATAAPKISAENKAPLPKEILGDLAPDSIVWKHKDDMYVDFSVLPGIACSDPEHFVAYMLGQGGAATMYHTDYRNCYIEAKELCTLTFVIPMMEMQEGHFCYLVHIGEVVGLLIIRPEDAVDILNRTTKENDLESRDVYCLQFMRFDPEAVKYSGLADFPEPPFATIQANFSEAPEVEEETN